MLAAWHQFGIIGGGGRVRVAEEEITGRHDGGGNFDLGQWALHKRMGAGLEERW